MTTQELIKLLFEDPAGVRLTQEFGKTSFSDKYLYNWHSGIDLAVGKEPAFIKTPVSGTVSRDDDWNLKEGYGRAVTINFYSDAEKPMSILLGHFSRNFVSMGDKVYRNQRIGEQGSSGASTGQHLHIDFMHGHVNPYTFQNNKAKFLSTFIDPRKLDEYINFSDNMIDQENIKKIQELRDLLRQAILLNDNRNQIMNYDSSILQDSEAQQFINSPEKIGIINEVYRITLDREVDQDGINFWKDKSIVELIRGIATSPEYLNKQNGNT